MDSKGNLFKVSIYTFFVFVFIWFVLIIRSASIIWIHNAGFIGYDRWSPFIRRVWISYFIAIIQTIVLLPGIYVVLRKELLNKLYQAIVAILPLCILNLFIEPIGIRLMYYKWGIFVTIGAVVLFPLFIYLIFILFSSRQKSLDTEIHLP